MAWNVSEATVSQVENWLYSEEGLARIDEWCRANGFTRATVTVSLVRAELNI